MLGWMHGMLDQAMAAALASGIPVAEMWIERTAGRLETRLMQHSGGPPAVGEVSRGETVARVWLDGTVMRYEGIHLGAGWTAPGGAA